ncbi:MAG: TlpA disulfide reductase family protein [Burkholderiales bacterium]|nr:TlpA disulfide reductase family protein [Burkholderiales bacterium]
MIKFGFIFVSLFASLAYSAPLEKFITWDKDSTPPALNVTTLNGKQVSLSDFSDQIVVLNFWATWCAPCIKEIPSLLSLKGQLPSKKFAVLFVNYGESAERIEKYWPKIGKGSTTFIDPGAKNTKPWIDIGLPTTVILNKSHQIKYQIVGDLDWSHPDIVSIIKSVQ